MMTRDDWIWVAIRIFGIFLIVMAVMAAPGIVSGVNQVWTWSRLVAGQEAHFHHQPPDSDDLGLIHYYRSSYATAKTTLAWHSVRLVTFVIVGIYFLRSGRIIFRLVRPPEQGN